MTHVSGSRSRYRYSGDVSQAGGARVTWVASVYDGDLLVGRIAGVISWSARQFDEFRAVKEAIESSIDDGLLIKP